MTSSLKLIVISSNKVMPNALVFSFAISTIPENAADGLAALSVSTKLISLQSASVESMLIPKLFSRASICAFTSFSYNPALMITSPKVASSPMVPTT